LHTTISGGSVTDLSFSGDGSYIAAAVTLTNGLSSVEIWRLPTTELLLQGQGALTKFPTTITTPDLLAMKFLTCGVVTASRATVVEHGSSKMLNILVQVWPFDESRAAKSILSTATQRVNVSLPLHGDSKDALTTTTQLALSSTDRFLVLSHRQSNLVVCLAIDPNIHAHTHYIPNGPRVPIIHATFLDLKWPVFSADTTIFAVKDHFSAAAMEHLEVSSYSRRTHIRT
jgi:WD40 repeat protein